MQKEKNLQLPVLNTEGKEIDTITLNKTVFDGKVNMELLHQAVVTYLSNKRAGLASTKTRAEVKGSGRKPWRQKGTGRARVGSIRSPLWRKGGIVFGPKPHSFRKLLPQKMKIGALKSALNAKLLDNEILILDNILLNVPKTKEFFKILKNLKLTNLSLKFVVPKVDLNLRLASRNIPKIEILQAQNLNTYDALNCKKIIFTKEALAIVENRILKYLS
ncbi:MAG: 50S ribosomal protein L4 [Candidatus Omnitrophica bacterium]|nr:50S ribosomal protein L4 [Candidatus Omnitrophota bacterium]